VKCKNIAKAGRSKNDKDKSLKEDKISFTLRHKGEKARGKSDERS
jgi:hypothetical protein